MTDILDNLRRLVKAREKAAKGPWTPLCADHEYRPIQSINGSLCEEVVSAKVYSGVDGMLRCVLSSNDEETDFDEPHPNIQFILSAGSFDFPTLLAEFERLRKVEAAAKRLRVAALNRFEQWTRETYTQLESAIAEFDAAGGDA